MENIIVYADITSWMGISIGAEHFYIKLEWTEDGELKSERVKSILTAGQAKKINKKERLFASPYTYKKGDEFNGFLSEELSISAAIKYFKENFKDPNILLCGKAYVCDVQECLWHKDDKIKDKINRLYKQAQKLNFWEIKSNWGKMEIINDKFSKLLTL